MARHGMVGRSSKRKGAGGWRSERKSGTNRLVTSEQPNRETTARKLEQTREAIDRLRNIPI